MRESLYDYCCRTQNEKLLSAWDVRNAPLTPQDVSYGSKRKVWWHCSKGHVWQSAVYCRSKGCGCPVCSGKLIREGENDLLSQYPDLVKQWAWDKNEMMSPSEVGVNSHRMVWWRCERGHEWRATVRSRTAGADCPYCSNRAVLPGENSLADTRPELAAQWDAEQNRTLTPLKVMAGSRKKVWWRCEKGHQWKASIASRAKSGCGCPVCAGKIVVPGENDLGAFFPAIAAEWDDEKNEGLTAQMVTPYANRKVWWRCSLGHSYQAPIAARTKRNCGCPYCTSKRVLPGFNDLATIAPEIAQQWHPTLNGNLTPEMVTAKSSSRVWWICPLGHVWKAVLYSRTSGNRSGCPVCAGTVRQRMRHGEQ